MGLRCRRRNCTKAWTDEVTRLCDTHTEEFVELVRDENRPGKPRKGSWSRQSKQAAWVRKVARKRPKVCVARGYGSCWGGIQCDHVMPLSQGGPYHEDNGAFLCAGHHQAKTEKRLRYRWEWLDVDQRALLAELGWVDWDEQGQPQGLGWRGFAPMNAAQVARKTGEVDR